jgi:hypothetical protein
MRLTRLRFCLGLLCLGLVQQAARAQQNVAVRWNDAALEAVRQTRLAPPMVARALAITHTCMYAAWAAYDPVATAPRLGYALRRPAAEQTPANKERAINYAAYRALVVLFPSEAARFDELMRELGHDPADDSLDPGTPAGVGNVAAATILAYRRYDGADGSDYHYQPANTPDEVRDPNRWQPLRLPDGRVQQFLAPHWGRVTPFALASAAQFRPGRPPAFYEHRAFGWPYRRQALELLQLSATLTDREKVIAEYWSDGPATETPPGHWCLHARWISRRDGHALDQDVKLFFALSNALLDASIAVWDCKRQYDYVRPVTAIRHLFKGQRVAAWAGPGLGTRYIFGEDWHPYQQTSFVTPPFGEYVSGHSAFSAASAEILKAFTGSDQFGAEVTLAAGSSRIEPGLVPAAPVTLRWAMFTEAADEAGMSRRYGGIHFEDRDLQGRILGRRVGAEVWRKAQHYFEGSAWE